MSVVDKNRITEVLTRVVKVYVRGEEHQEATAKARRLIRSLNTDDLTAFTLEALCDLYETPILDSIEAQIEPEVDGKVYLYIDPCEVVLMLNGDQETCPVCNQVADILPTDTTFELVCPQCGYRRKR
jgi:hypothetical protein